MIRKLIIAGIIIALGAVLTFSYFSSGKGSQGFIRKKGGSDESIYKRDIDVGSTRDVISRDYTPPPDCTSSYGSVSEKFDAINSAITKIQANLLDENDLFETVDLDPKKTAVVTPILQLYVDGMNDLDLAISGYKTAYEAYKQNSCSKEECSTAIQSLYDKFVERYAVHTEASNLTSEDEIYRDELIAKYIYPYTKLQEELDGTINNQEKKKIIEKMKALNSDPNIIAIKTKIKEISKAEKAIGGGENPDIPPGPTNKSQLMKLAESANTAISNFKAQCVK